MEQTYRIYRKLKKQASGYYAERILAELGYLMELFSADGEALPADFCAAVDSLNDAFCRDGTITRASMLDAEHTLARYSPRAKRLRLLCAAHAHIDMNWQWGTDETVAIVIDTFQTMLNLMQEFPDFTYSQSQAATYEMIEKYAPSMLSEIRQRVREGRWEVTASTWVEHDKNLSGTEAMLRHLLYSRQYLTALLDLPSDALTLDFEPDTFGHSANVPQLLRTGGVRYYYHCRGNDCKHAYRWRAASGDEVLVSCEPGWYLGAITYDMAQFVPKWCRENHTDTAMKVYGVGDHGGGPTRRDITRILDMAAWPLMPEIFFGRMVDFFRRLEQNADQLPVQTHENNFVFTGCYTSQARIKQANRLGEAHLYDSEALSAMAILAGGKCENPHGFFEGWKRILFNQFHDILPGSGIRETRECALAIAREANAYAIGNANRAMRYLGQLADTSRFGVAVDPQSTAEGAGVGYNTVKASGQERAFSATSVCYTATERGSGALRAYTVFNTTQYARREPVKLSVWDWPLALNETCLRDGEGSLVPFQSMQPRQDYWRHEFDKISFLADVPPFGFATYYLMEAEMPAPPFVPDEPRLIVRPDVGYVLENEYLRAAFEPVTFRLCSLLDKRSGREMLSAPAGFRLVAEVCDVMSSWRVGAYAKITDLNEACAVTVTSSCAGAIVQWLSYELRFGRSLLKVRVSLAQNEMALRWSVDCDFQELGGAEGLLPQLQLYVPYAYTPSEILYDVPGGALARPQLAHDVPAIGYACPIPQGGGSALFMTSDCKYGYRAYDNALILDLLRASTIPDRYPEQGVQQMEIGVGVIEQAREDALLEQSTRFSHPLFPYSNSLHHGTLSQRESFLHVSPQASVVALKPGETDGVALRLRNLCNRHETLTVQASSMQSAAATNLNETGCHPLMTDAHSCNAEAGAHEIVTIHLL